MGFQEDLAREGRSSMAQQLNKATELALSKWTQRWQLHGVHVSCLHCGGRQALSDSGKPFLSQHKRACAFSSEPGQVPFGDLAEILSGWHLELFDEDTDPY
jgi:hypothetical protein